MSLRPRFGEGGLLMRPMLDESPGWDEWEEVDVIGTHAPERDWDPFERTDSGLLLAEDFARADLFHRDTAIAWYMDRGVLDLRHLFPDERWAAPAPPSPDGFRDAGRDVRRQQKDVHWLLDALAKISRGEDAWEHGWMEVVIGGHDDDGLWIHPLDPFKLVFHSLLELPDDAELQKTAPRWVPTREWQTMWRPLVGSDGKQAGDGMIDLAPTRQGLIELVRRLIEPHVRAAAGSTIDLPWSDPELPLVVVERRRWRSLLSPVYLQILEGLRRVTEGQRGAAYCRECGRPFLILDSRRSSFCSDRDRFRHAQRARRERLARERAAKAALRKPRSGAKAPRTDAGAKR